jgi:hypothetical protein
LRARDARGQYRQNNQKNRSYRCTAQLDANRQFGFSLSRSIHLNIRVGVHGTIHHQLLKNLSLIGV